MVAPLKIERIEAIPITTRAERIWDPDVPLARRVPMGFAAVGAELRQYVEKDFARWKELGKTMNVMNF